VECGEVLHVTERWGQSNNVIAGDIQ
jgi:hypothetical protein